MKTLGLYLHIPFCRSKCLYCDFCSFPHPKKEDTDRYVEMLCRDVAQNAQACREHLVDTVYLGGGTPTILPVEQLERILDTVVRHYRIAKNAEITVECNPKTGSASLFSALRAVGFNRISLGLQSTHTQELRALGRGHTFEDFCRTYTEVREAGFSNVSVDVMFGIPYQTRESWRETLLHVCALAPEHVSAYGLIVEEGTPFERLSSRGELKLPDEDQEREMYFECIEILRSHGLAQYEISNFARTGYESRHNLKYWNCDEFLGFGPAAYSDFCGKRFGNSRDLAAYNKGQSILTEQETPSARERQNEYVMLRMRLTEGVSASAFAARFGISFDECFGKRLAPYIKDGFVRKREDTYFFTPLGMYVSNAILSDVLEF